MSGKVVNAEEGQLISMMLSLQKNSLSCTMCTILRNFAYDVNMYTPDESSDCFWYSCSGSESESQCYIMADMLNLKKLVGVAAVGRDGY